MVQRPPAPGPWEWRQGRTIFLILFAGTRVVDKILYRSGLRQNTITGNRCLWQRYIEQLYCWHEITPCAILFFGIGCKPLWHQPVNTIKSIPGWAVQRSPFPVKVPELASNNSLKRQSGWIPCFTYGWKRPIQHVFHSIVSLTQLKWAFYFTKPKPSRRGGQNGHTKNITCL
jgi:hypothetical protein